MYICLHFITAWLLSSVSISEAQPSTHRGVDGDEEPIISTVNEFNSSDSIELDEKKTQSSAAVNGVASGGRQEYNSISSQNSKSYGATNESQQLQH